MAEEESELDKPLMLFGRDVRKIPCFRNSFLYGISAGLGGGLLIFMFTSKPRWAAHSMVGTFVTVTLSYWTVCRIQWADQKFSMGQIQGAYKQMLIVRDEEKKKQVVKEVEVVEV